MKLLTLLTFFVISFSGFGEVEKVDIYFLSRPTAALNVPIFAPQFKGLFTENLKDTECVPMGDGCFHPQYGLIEDKSKLQDQKAIAKPKDLKVKTINAEEVDLINCDGDYYFDMYCGRAAKVEKKNIKPSELEIWIDTSASMSHVDYSTDDAYCDRRRLVAQLQNDCKKGFDVSVFNTSKKRLSTLDNLCINHGTNDGDRVVQWLKQTDAKHVVIITDTDEYVGALREYLDSIGANVHGIGVDPLLSSSLKDLKSEFLDYCK